MRVNRPSFAKIFWPCGSVLSAATLSTSLLETTLGACFILLTLSPVMKAQQPSVQAEVQRGLEALEQSKFSVAEENFSRALAADPSLAEVRANLGLAYYADGKYPQAIEAFRGALKQSPSLQVPQTFLPLSLAAVNQCDDALAGLRREFDTNSDVKLRRILGLSLQRCLLKSDRQAEADQVTQALLAKYPDDVDVLYEAGQMYGKLSSQLYLHLMQVAPHTARGYQVMGEVSATQGNWKLAVDSFRQALKLEPSLPGLHLRIAVLLLEHSPDPEAWQQALDDLHAELRTNPASSQAEYEVGEIYRKHRDPEQAASAFRRALALDPGLVEARLSLAKLLHEQKQDQQALSVLEPARDAAPPNAAVHFVLAQIYRGLGRVDDARKEQAIFERLQAPRDP